MSFNVEIIAVTPNALDVIEKAGRLCYNSQMNKETQYKFIADKVKKGHESILEHASVTFEIDGVSRALTHQLVRHRIGCSYSQQSQRYVKSDNFDYVIPEDIRSNSEIFSDYFNLMESIKSFYSKAVGKGIPAENARFMLPNATTTKIMVTMNFRALRHFIELRADKHAQWEIRELAKEILLLMCKNYKCCFDDLAEKYIF